MKRLIVCFCVLIISCLYGIGLSACRKQEDKLTISFESGEYGIATGVLTQTVTKKSEIIYPEVTANTGFIFIGYSPKHEDLPYAGNITVRAQYVKYEIWLVDPVTNERLGDDYKS